MPPTKRLAQIFGRRRFAIKPGIERISRLLTRLGNPEKSFHTIHVAGTNGKGSTASYLAAILKETGCTTGLFTSPHLMDYAERFQVNSELISQNALDSLVDYLLSKAEPEDTFFELTTAIACCHFAENNVQVAIMEAGMGGRNDATASVPGICTLLTPISLDHCQWLGNSLEAIAGEKIGIAFPGTPVFSALQDTDAHSVIVSYCQAHGNRLFLSGQDFQVKTEADATFCYQDSEVRLENIVSGIAGRYQAENMAVAIATSRSICRQLDLQLSAETIRCGIQKTKWPGRMELIRLDSGIRLLLDGAHNPAGAVALADSLADFSRDRTILLIGLMEDKELNGILGPLLPLADMVHTVAPDQDRALNSEHLATKCIELGKAATAFHSVADGLKAACAEATPDDLIVIAGSLFTVGEARAVLTCQAYDAVRG